MYYQNLFSIINVVAMAAIPEDIIKRQSRLETPIRSINKNVQTKNISTITI